MCGGGLCKRKAEQSKAKQADVTHPESPFGCVFDFIDKDEKEGRKKRFRGGIRSEASGRGARACGSSGRP